MIFKFVFDLLIQSVALFIIINIYQEKNHFTNHIIRIGIISFCISFFIRTCFYFLYNEILFLGILVFLSLYVLFYCMNSNKNINTLYYSLIISTLIFYIYGIIGLCSRAENLIVIQLYFYYYIVSLFITIIIISLLVYIVKIQLLIPEGKISFIILFSSILIFIIELLLIDQLKTISLNYFLYDISYTIIGLIFFSNNIIIQYLYNDFHQLTVSSQNNFLSKITDSYIHGIQKEQEKVYKIRHDIKNNIIILQHLINNNQIDDANKILNEINQNLKYKKSDVYTGNIFIDAYLTNIINSSQLDIEIKCSDLKELHYKPDILAIIINLVDNAVENALHNVTIHIKYDNKNSILMKVSNDCEKDPSKHLKKSKKQGDHGYGLRIVRDTINQYHGTYLTSYQNGVFTTYVMLKLGEDNEK